MNNEREMVLRGLETVAAEAPAEEAAGAVIDFVASDATVDRYGEVIEPEGWKLENYRRNPVFLNSHRSTDVLNTLGKALIVAVRYERLFLRVEFAVKENPIARVAYSLYRGGFLRAVSVGFMPLKWEDGKAGGPWRRRYLEQELLEVSAVGIPANPNALTLALEQGAVTRGDLLQALERLGTRIVDR
jgi:HK97 family phage prohead protease